MNRCEPNLMPEGNIRPSDIPGICGGHRQQRAAHAVSGVGAVAQVRTEGK